MDAGTHVPGRPRPVAGPAPLDAAGLARAWLLGLIAGRPLQRAPDVPVAAFAGRAPEVCAALAAALGDDTALDALAGHGAAVAEVVGAAGPHEAVEAVEVLRLAAGEALADPSAGDRLAHCCAVLAAAAATPAPPDPEVVAAGLLGALDPPAAVVALEADRDPGAATPSAPGAQVVAAGTGRWFVVAPAVGARALAERLTAELTASAGIAIRQGDEDPAELVALADERLFAARAAGVPVM